jgi:hypothetical protein
LKDDLESTASPGMKSLGKILCKNYLPYTFFQLFYIFACLQSGGSFYLICNCQSKMYFIAFQCCKSSSLSDTCLFLVSLFPNIKSVLFTLTVTSFDSEQKSLWCCSYFHYALCSKYCCLNFSSIFMNDFLCVCDKG